MNVPDDLRETAARWFSQARNPDFGPEQQQALATWLAEKPEHRAEYAALERIWEAAGALDPARLRRLATSGDQEGPGISAPAAGKPVRARAALCAATAAIAVGAAWFGWHLHGQPGQFPANPASHVIGQTEYRTATGERRTVMLLDGSRIELNTRTHLVVRMAAQGERDVDLLDGEAMFDVAHDASRPFVIRAGSGKVTVTGTRFDVHRTPSRTQVIVESGSVIVQGSDGKPPARLSAGLGTSVDSRGAVAATATVDLAAALAWRTGKLVFNDAPLVSVAAEVSRYRRQPVRIADEATGAIRMSSVFSADDTDGLLAALPRMLPVGVRWLPDGSAEIFLR